MATNFITIFCLFVFFLMKVPSSIDLDALTYILHLLQYLRGTYSLCNAEFSWLFGKLSLWDSQITLTGPCLFKNWNMLWPSILCEPTVSNGISIALSIPLRNLFFFWSWCTFGINFFLGVFPFTHEWPQSVFSRALLELDKDEGLWTEKSLKLLA